VSNLAGSDTDQSGKPPKDQSEVPPILSFAIPTWNRASQLKTCIEILATQILESGEPVEIVVSDNGSEDATPAVLQSLRHIFPFLRTFRNETNQGFDRNLLRALEESRGEYVWTFSDDDFLAPGALNSVLRVIRSHKPCHISTNYRSCDSAGKLLEVQAEEPFMLREDIAGADMDTLFLRQGMRISFFSRLIFNRSLISFDDCAEALDKVPHWLPVFITAQVAAGRQSAYLSSVYAVNWRPGHAREKVEVFLYEMPEAFSYILKRFGASDSTRLHVLQDIGSYFISWRSYMKFKSVGIAISPLLVPRRYKLIPRLPSSVFTRLAPWWNRISSRPRSATSSSGDSAKERD
jgi:glycosyltransferase involved in cell wall biosynthesis